MNINDLTIEQAKELSTLFGGNTTAAPSSDPLAGQYVIVRCYSAGVHAGEVVKQEGDIAILKNSRRLWSWKAKEGVALNGVAKHGIASGCKIDEEVALVRLTGVIETILATAVAKESINGK